MDSLTTTKQEAREKFAEKFPLFRGTYLIGDFLDSLIDSVTEQVTRCRKEMPDGTGAICTTRLDCHLHDWRAGKQELIDSVRSSTLEERDEQYKEIFNWLDGLGDEFPIRKPGEGAYYWRKPLREKLAALRTHQSPTGE